MPRPLSIALIAILFLAKPSLADDKAKPSPVTKRILDKAVAEVKKNRQEFDKANDKPLAEAKKALEDQAKKLIEDGKADEASAILGQVKTLEADVMKMANAPLGGGGRPAPQKPLLERMAGKWRRGETLTVDIQGPELQQSNGFKAELESLAPDIVEARFKEGWRWQLQMFNDDLVVAVRAWDTEGNRTDGVVLERIK